MPPTDPIRARRSRRCSRSPRPDPPPASATARAAANCSGSAAPACSASACPTSSGSRPTRPTKASAGPSPAPKRGLPGFGKAKNVILLFLQGGPSHIDLWDPKPDAPDNIRGLFKPIETKTPGLFFGEHMPKLAGITDKLTMIRSVSYTPVGLFNHTAAMYQMLTGYTPDKVSPTGQLDPPSPADYPNVGSNVIKLRPPDRGDAPVRHAAPAAPGVQRHRQGGQRRVPRQGV